MCVVRGDVASKKEVLLRGAVQQATGRLAVREERPVCRELGTAAASAPAARAGESVV